MGSTISARLWTDFIFLSDYLLLPFYLIIIYLIFFRICNKRYAAGHPWRTFFIAGFTVKILGALFIGMVYQYYYNGGDTSAFFYHANVINQSLEESPAKWLNLVLHRPSFYDGAYYQYISQMMWYESANSYIICSMTAVVNLFTFNTFLPTSIIFAALSFSGNWAMFRTFASRYPQHSRAIAIATLFIPSTFVWGSGIFKDTVCIAALGWLTYIAFKLLVERKFTLGRIIGLTACIYLLAVVKIYILMSFIPALLLWISFVYTSRIGNPIARGATKLLTAAVSIGGLLLLTSSFAETLGRYSLENLVSTSNITRSYIFQVSQTEDASSYDLGAFDPSIAGMLRKLPQAVNVTLFRPYLWEARKAMIFLNSIEASLFLFFTLKLLIAVGPLRVWQAISKDPNVQFFLIFTIIFAFSVGISSYNFGALSRYRIPCLPFYALALALIYYRYKPAESRFFSLNFR